MAELADFDLLRDVTTDIRSHPWADPQHRDAMVLHFRIKRAREEIHRLNIEMRRQVTFMRDEWHRYNVTADCLKDENPELAEYVRKEAMYLDAIFTHITFSLVKTRALPGFSGTLEPGTRGETIRLCSVPQPQWLNILQGKLAHGNPSQGVETSDSDDEDLEEELVMDVMESLVLSI
jgi:hypothetical protein